MRVTTTPRARPLEDSAWSKLVSVMDGVQAEIKYFAYWPEEVPPDGSEHFSVSVQVLIGEAGDDLADSFDIVVCSPSKLMELYDPSEWDDEDVLAGTGGNVQPVTGLWLMRRWSREQLEAGIRRVVRASSPGPDWGTVATRIGQLLPWEYDYRRDDQLNKDAGLPPLRSAWHDA